MSTRDLIDAIESGNSTVIQQHFQDAIMSRVAERLDTMRIETAKNMFKSAVNESADFIHQVLADNDINSKVMGNTVHVDHDDVEKAQEIVKYHGHDHKVIGGLNEAKKLIGTYDNGDHTAKVYHLSGKHNEGDPYHVKLFKDGKHHEPADYFTNDKDDAHSTAKDMVRRGARNESVKLDEANIVHTRKGANGYTYNVKQNNSNEYEIHSVDSKGKSKHIDTYQSLHRAKSVLDNEVKESVKLDETSCGTKKKWGAIKNSMGGSTKK